MTELLLLLIAVFFAGVGVSYAYTEKIKRFAVNKILFFYYLQQKTREEQWFTLDMIAPKKILAEQLVTSLLFSLWFEGMIRVRNIHSKLEYIFDSEEFMYQLLKNNLFENNCEFLFEVKRGGRSRRIAKKDSTFDTGLVPVPS